jgi:hypothetical protein
MALNRTKNALFRKEGVNEEHAASRCRLNGKAAF